MKSCAIPLALLAGCTAAQPPSGRGGTAYTAIGYEPFWTLRIAGDSIVLTRGPGQNEAGNATRSVSYPRVLPREENGVRRYESQGNGGVITIEARPGPCMTPERRRYPDRVRVMLSGVMLEGCGGREIMRGRR